MKDYIIDMKVFNNVPQEEIMLIVPLEQLQNGKLSPGTYQFACNTTERLLDQFLESTFTNADIKVLGIHSLTI
jgi:hypothetical protein